MKEDTANFSLQPHIACRKCWSYLVGLTTLQPLRRVCLCTWKVSQVFLHSVILQECKQSIFFQVYFPADTSWSSNTQATQLHTCSIHVILSRASASQAIYMIGTMCWLKWNWQKWSHWMWCIGMSAWRHRVRNFHLHTSKLSNILWQEGSFFLDASLRKVVECCLQEKKGTQHTVSIWSIFWKQQIRECGSWVQDHRFNVKCW